MSNTVHIGRKGWVGIALEGGTPGEGGDFPTKYIPYTAQTLHNVVDILDDEAAKGIRERAWGSAVARERGEGDITILLDAENSPYLLFPTLGVLDTRTVEAGVYLHTMMRKGSNPPRTFCLNINDTVGTRKYHYGTVNTAEITFSDGWVEMTCGILSKKPEAGVGTLGITEETVMAFKDAKIYFGATIAAAEATYAIGTDYKPLSAFRVTINNNAEAQYVAGSSSPRQISMGQFEVGGDYTLFFENTDEQAQHEQTAGPQRAMIISFTGSSIGATSTEEILIKIPKFHLTDRGIDTAPAGFVTENPTFVADYDSTDGSIEIAVRNITPSYSCGTSWSSSSSSVSSSSMSSSSSSRSSSSNSSSSYSSSSSSFSC